MSKEGLEDISIDSIDTILGSVSLQTIYEDIEAAGDENYLTQSSLYLQQSGLAGQSPILFLNGKPNTEHPMTVRFYIYFIFH